MNEPLISICVPAYRKPQYIVRLLDSIINQDYTNIEIIISDDSPGEDTKQAIEQFRKSLNIKYVRNQLPLKSPRNWNNALNYANGDFVVLMHQDDWYHSTSALSTYIKQFKQSNADFVFCQNTAVDENGNTYVLQEMRSLLKRLSRTPNHLVLSQIIGPPSNTMLRKGIDIRYDERFIWLVDVDYYCRLLRTGYRYSYIENHLVSIGIHEDQTTTYCRTNSDIIFRENIWFAAKIGKDGFKDILVYDYYWRLLRNNRIKTKADFEANKVDAEEIPFVILHMLRLQSQYSSKVLSNGLVSKLLMTWSFLNWRLKKN